MASGAIFSSSQLPELAARSPLALKALFLHVWSVGRLVEETLIPSALQLPLQTMSGPCSIEGTCDTSRKSEGRAPMNQEGRQPLPELL